MQTNRRTKSKDDAGDDSAVAAAGGKGFGVQVTDAQYQKLAKLVYRLCGINLGDSKKELLKARLAKRLRATGCPDVRTYISQLEEDSSGTELVCFLDVITTNKTDFFREPQHFEFMAKEILPKLDKLCGPNEALRLWSAASSTGEEIYTIAIVLQENKQHWSRRGAQLFASDLSTQVLEHGRRAVYTMERAACIPRAALTRYFQRGQNRWQGHVRVRPELRNMVEWRRVNLMDPFNFKQRFHVIFCRNVMIYFDKPTQERLVQKFHDCLVPGGYLFVGHSESLTGITHRLGFVRPAVYRREN
jgi:chemotaxis protein methyltransferase CheR